MEKRRVGGKRGISEPLAPCGEVSVDAFEAAYCLVMADDPWLRKLLKHSFGSAMPPYREFLGALRQKLYQMKAAGHWSDHDGSALARLLRTQAERHLRKHPPMERYGFGSIELLASEIQGETIRLRVGVCSLTEDDALGGTLSVLPGPGLWCEPVTVDQDDYAQAVIVELNATLADGADERVLLAEFHGYDVCYCDGEHVLSVVKTARLKV